MRNTQDHPLSPLGTTARRVASALIAGFWRRRDLQQVENLLAGQPLRDQIMIVGAVLAALFCAALLAAQFGWIAMLGFWLGVIVIVN